jgi:hypothetical protein
VTILSFLVLTTIGGLIEFTVTTPLSRYLEKLTGPRIRTLRQQLKVGNHEFVFRSIRPKFHDEPYDEDFASLYRESTKGVLLDLFRERKWDRATAALTESIDGMPLSPAHRTDLRRIYSRLMLKRVVERIADENELMESWDFRKRAARDREIEKTFSALREEIIELSKIERDDAGIQLLLAKIVAHTMWGLDVQSLSLFERAIGMNAEFSSDKIFKKVLMAALIDDPNEKTTILARKMIQLYHLDEFLSSLRDNLKPLVFGRDRISEYYTDNDRYCIRLNSYLVLKQAQKADRGDDFLYSLQLLAHTDEQTKRRGLGMDEFKRVIAYFEDLHREGKLAATIADVQLPEELGISVIKESPTHEYLALAWPLISGPLAFLFEAYCQRWIGNQGSATSPSVNLKEHCAQLLKSGREHKPHSQTP